MDPMKSPSGSRAVAIPRQESSGGASAGRSAHSASSGPRAIASPFSQRASYVDDDDDEEPTIDPEDLWAPMGTPIPPATTGWWGKKTAVREYAPRRARSAVGSPATPEIALPSSRARPSRPRRPHFQAYWQQEQIDAAAASGQVFQAVLRVNGTDRTQAFVSVDGLTSDVLLKGPAQNRAVDGDEVAVHILPPTQWHHMRGGALPSGDLFSVPASDPPMHHRHPHVGGLGRRDSDSSGGVLRRSSHTTPVAAIHEGILDNGAIEEGEEEGSSSGSAPSSVAALAGIGEGDEDDDGVPGFLMDAEALSSAALLGGRRPPPPAPRSESGMATATWPRTEALSDRFSEALAMTRQQAAARPGGLSQALGSPPASGAPLSASWEGTRSNWAASGWAGTLGGLTSTGGTGRWAGLTAQRGGPLPMADPPLTPGRRFNTRSASAVIMRAPSSATSARSISSLTSFDEDEPEGEDQTPAAAIAAMNRLLEADPYLRATGQVVGIARPSRRRKAVVGILKEEGVSTSGGGLLFLMPRDARLPRAVVQPSMLPAGKRGMLMREAAQPADADGSISGRTLVSASIDGWDEQHAFPSAKVEGLIGPTGDLACETQALLAAESAPVSSEFPDQVLAELPAPGWAVSDADLAGRRDLRGERVFSIDPPTARDLDDALSVQRLPGGDLRVGVHIADVSHFVRPGTELDAEARLRGTSVYLMDRVIPMLPRRLCEELCSLQPGGPRLTFSIIWDLSPEGEIRSQWAGRTIINSCGQLAYGHAQAVIDGQAPPEAPAQLHGAHTWQQVADDIRALHAVAQKRRAARQAAGALRLDNTKLAFQLDASGQPISCSAHEQREANQLVEEFMLLANISVATSIAASFPDRALLRRHPQPNARKLAAAASAAKDAGLEFDTTSAGALAASLRTLKADGSAAATAEVLQLLFTKPMQLAQYFCTGTVSEDQWAHYALAMPRYTHFTSPIRRYPDVVVHRLLAAALERNSQQQPQDPLDPQPQPAASPSQPAAAQPAAQQAGSPQPAPPQQQQPQQQLVAEPRNRKERRAPLQQQWRAQQQPSSASTTAEVPSTEEVSDIARHCNDTKTAAKAVQDAASKLYLGALLAAKPALAEAIVTSVNGGAWFDVYVPRFGHEARLQTADMACASSWNASAKTLTLEPPRGAVRRSLSTSGPSGAAAAATAAAAAALAGLPGSAAGRSAAGGRAATAAGSGTVAAGSSTVAAGSGRAMAAEPSNEAGLAPLPLPAQLRAFSRVPVVLTAGAGGAAARPFDIAARLLLPTQ